MAEVLGGSISLLGRAAAWLALLHLSCSISVVTFGCEHVPPSTLRFLVAALGLLALSELLPLTVVAGSLALCVAVYNEVINAPSRPHPSFARRIAIVTGSSSGIGEEVAAQLLQSGAIVVFACRSEKRAQQAIARCLQRSAAPPSAARFLPLELCDAASVRRFAERVVSECPKIDLLVCNAGAMCKDRVLTSNGLEMHMAANAIGHHLLATLLLPKLRECASSRIVQVVSSMPKLGGDEMMAQLLADPMSERSFNMFHAYSRSKLAQVCTSFVMHSRELYDASSSRRRAVPSVAIHPGNPDTAVVRDFPLWLRAFYGCFFPIFPLFKGTVARAGAAVVYACHCPEGEAELPIYLERTRVVPPAASVLASKRAERVVEMLDGFVRPWNAPLGCRVPRECNFR